MNDKSAALKSVSRAIINQLETVKTLIAMLNQTKSKSEIAEAELLSR
jgi:hypothetical protein